MLPILESQSLCDKPAQQKPVVTINDIYSVLFFKLNSPEGRKPNLFKFPH